MSEHDEPYCHITGQVFRRPKRKPCEDFWHTIRVGLVLAALMMGVTTVVSMF